MTEPDISVLQLLGHRDEQQDATAYDVVDRSGQRRTIIAVADGHDKNGAKAATLAVTRAIEMINAGAEDFSAVFDCINSEIVDGMPRAGTTLTLAIREAMLLTIAYVGDSEAWMLKSDRLQRLTVPHRHGKHRGETNRLDHQFGQPCISGGAITLPSGAYLSVTRALGDPEFEPYVLHDPEVRQIELDGDERFLLVGSDGFWECATKRKNWRRQLQSALSASSSSGEAVRLILADLARRETRDNCTAVLASLNLMNRRIVAPPG